MSTMYRVTCTGYDLCAHMPCVGRIARNMHGTRIRAIKAAQKAAVEDVAALIENSALTMPFSVSVNLDDRFQKSEATNAATIMYVDHEGKVHVYSEYQVWEVKEGDNTHNFLYRGFRIEYDTNDQWNWIYYLSNKRNHRWSGRSLEACLDVIDEVCNDMLAEGM